MTVITYLKGLIRDIEISLRDQLGTTSTGSMKNWVAGLAEDDLQDLMNRIKSKFVIADPQMIAEMELSLTNGLMSKGEKSFLQVATC